MTTVVNILKDKYDVDGARSGKWGNPFFIGRDGSRVEVVRRHRWWLMEQLHLLIQLPELKNKRVGCYCCPKLCHVNNLADLATTWNGGDNES